MQRPEAPGRWELFEHGADIGVRGIGGTPAEAFQQVALALTAVVTSPAGVKLRVERKLQCEGSDLESLLYEWLNAVIYEMSVEKLIFGRFNVTIDGAKLTATLSGEQVVAERHQPATEIKGATYTELRVTKRPNGSWCAQCIVDV